MHIPFRAAVRQTLSRLYLEQFFLPEPIPLLVVAIIHSLLLLVRKRARLCIAVLLVSSAEERGA